MMAKLRESKTIGKETIGGDFERATVLYPISILSAKAIMKVVCRHLGQREDLITKLSEKAKRAG